jgi:hypothetical protein
MFLAFGKVTPVLSVEEGLQRLTTYEVRVSSSDDRLRAGRLIRSLPAPTIGRRAAYNRPTLPDGPWAPPSIPHVRA